MNIKADTYPFLIIVSLTADGQSLIMNGRPNYKLSIKGNVEIVFSCTEGYRNSMISQGQSKSLTNVFNDTKAMIRVQFKYSF